MKHNEESDKLWNQLKEAKIRSLKAYRKEMEEEKKYNEAYIEEQEIKREIGDDEIDQTRLDRRILVAEDKTSERLKRLEEARDRVDIADNKAFDIEKRWSEIMKTKFGLI